jgi:hypothetical protein
MGPGVIAGGVAASATAGALVAMGTRLGSALLPFGAIGSVVAGGPPRSMVVQPGVVVLGIVGHIVVTMLWALVFARLTERWRGAAFRAALFVAAGAMAAWWLVGSVTGRGIAVVLPLGDHVVFGLVLALSLVGGMRFAFPIRELR